MRSESHYVHGARRKGRSGRHFENVDPATGEVLGPVPAADAAEVDEAVASAREGFERWSALPGAERGRVLHEAARRLRERNDELAELEVLDTGKPIAEARTVDVTSAADCLEYYAGLAGKIRGEHVELPPSAFVYTRREPLGVCAGLGAWNYPLQVAAWKAAPALACGNALVYKPSELTPITAVILAEILSESGAPPGVLNVVQGDEATGRLLTRHEGVAKVSLTGEVATGKKVMADAAGTLKQVTMELGGKSPLLVFADAHLENAVSGAILANFFTQGEICSNAARVFVEESIREAFLERLVERVRRMKIGDPKDPATDVGALISRGHLEKVLDYVRIGREEGARLVVGGGRPEDPALAGGFFVEPTVFDGCTDDMRIVREEIFGPVMALLSFEEEAEAVRRANDTPYGLSAGVFTRDLQRAHRVIARLQAGTCWINHYNVTPIEMPFGGVKQSGFGRENGLAALEHYTQLKSVYVELGDVEAPY